MIHQSFGLHSISSETLLGFGLKKALEICLSLIHPLAVNTAESREMLLMEGKFNEEAAA